MTPVNILDPHVRILTPKARRKIEIQERWSGLLREIANRHLVPPGLITGKCKQPKIVRARDEFILAVFDTGCFSMNEIGRRISMHHTAVGTAIRRERARVLA